MELHTVRGNNLEMWLLIRSSALHCSDWNSERKKLGFGQDHGVITVSEGPNLAGLGIRSSDFQANRSFFAQK